VMQRGNKYSLVSPGRMMGEEGRRNEEFGEEFGEENAKRSA